MKIGFIGAGSVAKTYAKSFVQAGHEVTLSNSRGPESIAELVRSLGPKARAGTVQEAAKQEIVVLAVRWEQAKEVLAQIPDWKGRILVDATNRPVSDAGGKGGSQLIASYTPGASVIKALNTLVVNWIQDDPTHKTKLILFMSGDDKGAKAKLASVLDESGFAAVDLGGLEEFGRLQEFGAPLSGLHVNLIKKMS